MIKMADEENKRSLDYVASDLIKADGIMKEAGLSEEDRARVVWRCLRAGDVGCGPGEEHLGRLQEELLKLYLEQWKIGHESPIEDERWGRGRYDGSRGQV